MLDLEIDDGLAVLTINRPHARNAIALDTMEQLEKALDAALTIGDSLHARALAAFTSAERAQLLALLGKARQGLMALDLEDSEQAQ